MPRKRTVKGDTEARKKRVRSFRSRERSQRRKHQSNAPEDLTWLKRDAMRSAAMRVINFTARTWTPYWLSIAKKHKPEGSADFWPAKSFERDGRIYYGFLLREHRDQQCLLWPKARKELTSGG